ncbi:MAG: response regulator [Lachnospiraceae bacterium]|nr:response regulator [Lachnospiraceae bacterium]
MIDSIKYTWKELGRTIFVGERFKANIQGMAFGSVLIVIISVVTGYMNLDKGYIPEARTAILGIVSGIVILYFSAVQKNRTVPIVVATIYFMVNYTYDTFYSTNGFAILWTMLLPLALGYLGSVRAGIILSGYFVVLFFIVFYTPLKYLLEGYYPEAMLQRFPLLYLANAMITIYILIQYHMNTLHQMDNAKQLMEAKEEADKFSAAKSRFLAGISDEIRTPMNAIIGMDEMILRKSEEARTLDYADRIRTASKNLHSIISDVADLSKLEAGNLELVSADYTFASLLNDIVDSTRGKAEEKGLSYELYVDPRIPSAFSGDSYRVRQVMLNIVNNAIKYTDSGSVKLDFSFEPAEGMLRFSVSDTGTGIKKEDMDKLFQSFSRINEMNKRNVEGTGLGLNITKQLVELMDGSITVESEYKKGSVFTIEIRQGVADETPIGDYTENLEIIQDGLSESSPVPDAPKAKVLIVDDSEIDLMILTDLLGESNMQVTSVSSWQECVEILDEKKFNVIFLHISMPGPSGTSLIREIKDKNLAYKTPVIGIMPDAISGRHDRIVEEGYDDTLSTPVMYGELKDIIWRHLDRRLIQTNS